MSEQKLPNSNPIDNERGFSLVELLIVSIVLLAVLGIMTTIITGVQSNYSAYRDRSGKHAEALASINLISRIIRNAGDNTTQTAFTATGNDRLRIKSDWTTADNNLDDAFEDVEFYVSNDTLFMVHNGATASTAELAQNIKAIEFEYFDAAGANTSVMTNVARIKVTIEIAGDEKTLVSVASVRKMIQPR